MSSARTFDRRSAGASPAGRTRRLQRRRHGARAGAAAVARSGAAAASGCCVVLAVGIGVTALVAAAPDLRYGPQRPALHAQIATAAALVALLVALLAAGRYRRTPLAADLLLATSFARARHDEPADERDPGRDRPQPGGPARVDARLRPCRRRRAAGRGRLRRGSQARAAAPRSARARARERRRARRCSRCCSRRSTRSCRRPSARARRRLRPVRRQPGLDRAEGDLLRARRRGRGRLRAARPAPSRPLSVPLSWGDRAARVRVAQLPARPVAVRQLVLRGRRARARCLPRARGSAPSRRSATTSRTAPAWRRSRSAPASRASCTTASRRRCSTCSRRCAACRRSGRDPRRIACWAPPSARSPSRARRSRRCARRSTSRCRRRSRASAASWAAASSSTCTSRRTRTSTSSRPCATRSRGSSARRSRTPPATAARAARRSSCRPARRGRLRVRDDGRGFDPDPARVPDGAFGLQAMRERAAAVGGRTQIRSAPGDGTEVEVTLP